MLCFCNSNKPLDYQSSQNAVTFILPPELQQPWKPEIVIWGKCNPEKRRHLILKASGWPSLEPWLPDFWLRIHTGEGSLLGLLFPGQRQDNPGRGLRCSPGGRPPVRPLRGPSAEVQGHVAAELTSWPRRGALSSCPETKSRRRGQTDL